MVKTYQKKDGDRSIKPITFASTYNEFLSHKYLGAYINSSVIESCEKIGNSNIYEYDRFNNRGLLEIISESLLCVISTHGNNTFLTCQDYKKAQKHHCSASILKTKYRTDIYTYYHNKFVFDGIDKNVKINDKKLNKELDKEIKKTYGKDTQYTAVASMIDVNDNGKLALCYGVKILQKNAETKEAYEYVQCYVSLDGDEVDIYSAEKM